MVRGSSGHGALMVRVLRDANLRTRSGPEGSSRKRALAGAVGCLAGATGPGSARAARGRRRVHGHFSSVGSDVAEDKQHQALYRRYRPQTPAEVLGQDHVVRALTGAIRENRLHHAFLFCGPRGTGKTSTARILAKMVNCEHGPDRRAVRDLHAVRRHPRGPAPGRRGDRRGVARRRRGRPGAPRARADRAGDGPREGLHHRRGAAPLPRGVRRAAEGLRGAAARRAVRAGDHRAAQDAGDDRRAGASGSTSAGSPWRRSRRSSRRSPRPRAAPSPTPPRSRSPARPRAPSRDALSLLDQASVLGGETIDDAVVAVAPRRPARRGPARARRRRRGRRRAHRVRDRQPPGAGRPGPPQRDGRDPRALPQPAARQDRARTGRPPRHPGRRLRAAPRPGREVHPRRARPRDLAAARRPERHALDHHRPACRSNWPWSAPRSPRPTPTPPASSPASNASNAWRTSTSPLVPALRRAVRRTRRLFRSSLLRSSGPQGRRLPTHRPPSTSRRPPPMSRLRREGSRGGATLRSGAAKRRAPE